jgi:moderate conductance mechanosensitive channel
VVATPTALGLSSPATATLARACGRAPGIACRLIWDLSHSTHAAEFTSVYLAGPIRLTLRILLVLLIAVILRLSATRVIGRIMARTVVGHERADRPHVMFGERRRQRATALASILGNAASLTIFTVAGLIILGDLGLNLAPVLASAGVLGIAIGFGAQSLVQDFLAGIFILLEDQYGVGDVIEVSAVSGTVEAVSLRITRLRDVNGVVWHIRNGTIKQAGNETHGWARAVVDFPVPYGLTVAAARSALEHAATEMAAEPRWQAAILDRPEVWGVETISADTVLIRVAARTAPLARQAVAREMRERLKQALDIELAAAPAGAAAPGGGLAVPRQGRMTATGPAPSGRPSPGGDDEAEGSGEDALAAWPGSDLVPGQVSDVPEVASPAQEDGPAGGSG